MCLPIGITVILKNLLRSNPQGRRGGRGVQGGLGNRGVDNVNGGRGYIKHKAIVKDGYCWSCGWRTNHKSPDCFWRIEGHVASATRADRKNCSNMNKGWKWGSRGDAFSKVNETKEKFHITANVSTHRNYSDITKFIADSGTTGNFMPSGSKVINIKKSTVLIEVKPPAGKIVESTETGWLSNKDLPMEARTVHISLILNMR